MPQPVSHEGIIIAATDPGLSTASAGDHRGSSHDVKSGPADVRICTAVALMKKLLPTHPVSAESPGLLCRGLIAFTKPGVSAGLLLLLRKAR